MIYVVGVEWVWEIGGELGVIILGMWSVLFFLKWGRKWGCFLLWFLLNIV